MTGMEERGTLFYVEDFLWGYMAIKGRNTTVLYVANCPWGKIFSEVIFRGKTAL